MSQSHIVRAGETLHSLALGFFGDPDLFTLIAGFNGIRSPGRLIPGQRIQIPDALDLAPSGEYDISFGVAPPFGLDGILASFGNIYEYLNPDGTLDPRWGQDQLRRVRLPFPLQWSLDPGREVHSIVCHKRLAGLLPEVFRRIEDRGARGVLRSLGGCYGFRTKRGQHKLSAHCWGIAIDLNPETNWLGSPGDMAPEVVEAFCSFGFTWGGHWEGEFREPMHFQFCNGY